MRKSFVLEKSNRRHASRLLRHAHKLLSFGFVLLLVLGSLQIFNASTSAGAVPISKKKDNDELISDHQEESLEELDAQPSGEDLSLNANEDSESGNSESGNSESDDHGIDPSEEDKEKKEDDVTLDNDDSSSLSAKPSLGDTGGMMTPMSIPVGPPGGPVEYHMPDPGVAYLAFEVKDTSGNHVGGATVNLQGPRTGDTSSWPDRWGSSVAVVDCVTGPSACPANSLDQDSRPGYFAVDKKNTTTAISSSSRYRIGASASAPAGYSWNTGALTGTNETTATNNTVTGITSAAGSSTNTINNPANGQWVNTSNPSGTGSNAVNRLAGPVLVAYAPQCTAGNIYAVSGTGQLQHIAPNGNNAAMIYNVGTSASGVSNFNGIGVTPHTSTVNPGSIYALERSAGSGTNVNGRVYKFNTTTGQWARISSGSVWDINGGSNLVGGAASPDGNYWAGGFNSSNDFRLWSLNATGTGMVSRGTLNLSPYRSTNGNGDFSFDAAGNLYLLRGLNSGNELTIFRVNAADLQAGGSAIPTTRITPANSTGGTGVNGVAYDSTGRLYVGGSNWLSYVISPYTSSPTSVSLSGGTLNSTDLASCSYPPTVTLQKDIPDGRAANGHQFNLSLSTGGSTLGTIPTTGNASGIQQQKVGPLPIPVGATVTLSETFTGGAQQSQYESSWACKAQGDTDPLNSGTGVAGSFIVPDRDDGAEIICTFTNKQLTPRLEAIKTSNPETGTTVSENEEITYTLTFDNSTGTAAATVNHRDWLRDVLDDAYFIDGAGNPTASPVITSSNGLTATWNAQNQRIDISGSVPAGQTRTVTFRVKAKENVADVSSRENSAMPLKGYLLRNYLTPANVTTPPDTCEAGSDLCTEHPVPAWTFGKSALPVSGAALHKGGNAHYRLAATKMNSSAQLKTVTFRDDLTQVFKTAGWAPNAAVPGGALPRGVYFFDADGKTLNQAGAVTGTQPAPAYAANTVGPPVQDGSGNWILEMTVNVPANALRAELWFAVQAGETPAGIPATLGMQESAPPAPITAPASGWHFVNYASASATDVNDVPFAANQCDTVAGTTAGWWRADTSLDPRSGSGAIDSNVPVECRTDHVMDANYFTIRKDAAGVGEDLPRTGAYGTDATGLWNMIGHEFEIRDDVNGAPSSSQSQYLCRTAYNPGAPVDGGTPAWNGNFITGGTLDSDQNSATLAAIKAWNNVQTDPAKMLPECAIAYAQVNAGGQTGRWKVENLPEEAKTFDNTSNAAATGNYWLVETKAPDRQISLDGSQTRPVPGVQLLADPVPFKVWTIDDGVLWPTIPGQNSNEQARAGRGQLDIATSENFGAATAGNYLDRCLPGGTVGSRPVACVNPTGYLMIVKDTVPMKLPLAGGFGTEAYVLGGTMALAMAFAGLLAWRRLHMVPAAARGRYASERPVRARGRHGA